VLRLRFATISWQLSPDLTSLVNSSVLEIKSQDCINNLERGVNDAIEEFQQWRVDFLSDLLHPRRCIHFFMHHVNSGI